MQHQFNTDLAIRFGIEKAILLHNLAFWIHRAAANNKHAHGNYYWIYNSAEAWAKLHPYIKPRTVSRYLKDLEKSGIIKSDNFNKLKYDRTKWYTIIDKSICIIYDIPLVNLANGKAQNDRPIPDSITDSVDDDKINSISYDNNKKLPSVKIQELIDDSDLASEMSDVPQAVIDEYNNLPNESEQIDFLKQYGRQHQTYQLDSHSYKVASLGRRGISITISRKGKVEDRLLITKSMPCRTRAELEGWIRRSLESRSLKPFYDYKSMNRMFSKADMPTIIQALHTFVYSRLPEEVEDFPFS